jgi:dihydrofolate synthase / folylpolyglutamate synthase
VDSLQFLFSLERLGMKFGLENMRTICSALGHPERTFGSVIVAGTNGKGSVTAMVSAGLHAAGRRGARYTSPHLERLEERFVIAEHEVETEPLEAAADKVRQAVEDLVRRGELETLPTFFEFATALAFELFRRAAVEVAVLEVGLGGRLDATNVITPVAAAITSIDFDHEDLLGGTLGAIAREKAGVIKPGIAVVAGPLAPEARAVIEEVCREQQARFVSAPDRVTTSADVVDGRTLAGFRTARLALSGVPLALRGRHQLDNAAVAVCLMEALSEAGIDLNDSAVRAGLTDARWPGRLERFAWRGADVILDAAHNPGGARALAAYLRECAWTHVTLVIGAMADKDVPGMLAPLVPLAASIVCTTPPNARAMPSGELASLASALAPASVDVRSIPNPPEALGHACRDGARVVVAGSIFLIGPLRGILR